MFINNKNIKQVVNAIEKFTAEDVLTRACLATIHVLSTTETTERLCATDGCGLVIIDVDKEYLDYACGVLMILKRIESSTGGAAYIARKKLEKIKDIEIVFPYPIVLNVINRNDWKASSDKPVPKYFSELNLSRINKLLDVTSADRKIFYPNYTTENAKCPDLYVEEGLFILAMPLCLDNKGRVPKSINEYLPGLLPETKKE